MRLANGVILILLALVFSGFRTVAGNYTRPEYLFAMGGSAGLHDSQVQYWESAKRVARLRALRTDSNRLLLKTNMDAGHGGASGRYKRFREIALNYAFILDLVGISH